jgi:hypothetical protein
MTGCNATAQLRPDDANAAAPIIVVNGLVVGRGNGPPGPANNGPYR